jgi:hypothetical protein
VSRPHFSSPSSSSLRHQYDGEKDVRGPRDFSGKTSSPLDGVKEGDDDDGDEDDDGSRLCVGEKRGADGRMKGDGKVSNGSTPNGIPSEVRSLNDLTIFIVNVVLPDGIHATSIFHHSPKCTYARIAR